MPTQQAACSRQRIRENFAKYFTVLYTPFDSSGDVDEASLRRNVDVTLGLPGVGGISLHSIHQEFWTLTLDERKRVTDVVVQAVDGRKPIIAGVSDTSEKNVIDLARHAEAAGVDAVMVWPPYYGPKTATGIQKFYESVASRINVGMFVYSTTLSELGFYLTPDMVESLLDIDNLCGVQNSTMNFAQYASMMERVGGRISVSTSLEEYFLFGKMVFKDRAPNFMMGSSRPLLVQSHLKPICGRFIDLALKGQYEDASSVLREIIAIADKLQSRYFARGFHHVSLFKEIATHHGLISGGVRSPDSAPRDDELAECMQVLREAGVIPRV